MAVFKMTIPHKLSSQDAVSRIKNLFGKLQQEQQDNISNVKEDWNGNKGNFSFSARGYNLSGTITVQDYNIDINATVPFAVLLFKDKIKKLISSKSTELLA